MCNDFNNDNFENDILGESESLTPDFNSLTTNSTNKLLVVIFIVDCSRTMEGDRIKAVNAALKDIIPILQNIKNTNNLDLKISIMSFTSSTKWELDLTDIDEVSLEKLKTRPGLTEYGNAFHELNKVLSREKFLKHKGKIARPAIMLLTDGGPTSDYENDLNELLANELFAEASRSAVLMGDAIDSDSAKKAVRKFVSDPENDIVSADDSINVIQKIKIKTLHNVVGEPSNMKSDDNDSSEDDMEDPFFKCDEGDYTFEEGDETAQSGEDVSDEENLFEESDIADPFGGSDEDSQSEEGDITDLFAGIDDIGDPFGGTV